MTTRIRGIYATALTSLLEEVVQASAPIARRFDDSFQMEYADVTVDTTPDRQGVGVHGPPEAVDSVCVSLESVGIDTLSWRGKLPRGGVYAGEVTETLGSGALVDCGDGTGFLPYSKTARHIEKGDALRVQVVEPRPPWSDGRPVLDTTIRISGELATLHRGGFTDNSGGQPELAEILPVDPPNGWGVEWGRRADDASLDALTEALETQSARATSLDEAFTDAPTPDEAAPHRYWADEQTRWVWFGRESRFELDAIRREVTTTMPGHHRIKAGTDDAGTAVDFVESVCPDIGDDDSTDRGAGDGQFPFATVLAQFGPREGDSISIGHGKPAGHRIELGRGEVTDVTDDGQVTVQRELSGGGTYDALDIPRQDGDVAVTKFKEGRWWYPTIYRSEDGELRGTYVNVCTPVEVFPREIRYVDLHVDVVKHADGTVERVDDDELEDALDAGELSLELTEKARAVASAVENAL